MLINEHHTQGVQAAVLLMPETGAAVRRHLDQVDNVRVGIRRDYAGTGTHNRTFSSIAISLFSSGIDFVSISSAHASHFA